MKLNDFVTAKISSLSFGAEGITLHEGLTGFVRGGLPGETVKFRITEIRKNLFKAEVLKIVETSPLRVEPPCPHFNKCAGCAYQHLDYSKQLEEKGKALEDLLIRIGKINNAKITRIITSPKIFNYRNQLTLKIKTIKNSAKLGFIGFDNKTFIPIERCLIAKEEINRTMLEIENELSKGVHIKRIDGEIVVKCAHDGTIGYGFTESISPKGDYALLSEKIEEKIYYFSLATFFQTNPSILPDLLSSLRQSLPMDSNTTIFDCYCGTGLFSIYLAPFVKNVFGIEINSGSVRLAKKTAEANAITNCVFMEGETEKLLPRIYDKNKSEQNIIILDPPRAGLSKDIMEYLLNNQLGAIIYISCEPSKLARDLNILSQNGYVINNIIAADMFPQTKHLETISILQKG